VNRVAGSAGGTAVGLVLVAWFVTSVYYFYQYMIRSAPAVMVPEMATGLGLTTAGVAGVIGLFYYAYAPFSLVAGVAMDQIGPRRVVPIGCATLAIGALLFSTGDPTLASIGRFVQGAGGVFALIGAVYLATTTSRPPARRR
jgi:sugar phosphate permease